MAIVFAVYGYPIVHTIYAALVAILFSMFFIYDTQQIMGGNKHEISPEDYIYASVELYVDIILLFLNLLKLLSACGCKGGGGGGFDL